MNYLSQRSYPKINSKYGRTSKRVLILYVEIVKFFSLHHRMPTIRQCMARTDYLSTSAVTYALQRLATFGLLTLHRIRDRDFYRITGGAWTRPAAFDYVKEVLERHDWQGT